MKSKSLVTFIFISLCISFYSCTSEYTKAVEAGLKSGIRYDSLFLGMKIGQTRDDFYKTCWELNKQKLISEGPGNMTAKYIEPVDPATDSLKRKQILFYGIFDENNVMQGMQMTYSYYAWSTWDKDMHANELIKELLAFYEKNYLKNPFMEVDLGLKDIKAYAKIDGNRQITIYQQNEKDVVVKIEDLSYKFNKKK